MRVVNGQYFLTGTCYSELSEEDKRNIDNLIQYYAFHPIKEDITPEEFIHTLDEHCEQAEDEALDKITVLQGVAEQATDVLVLAEDMPQALLSPDSIRAANNLLHTTLNTLEELVVAAAHGGLVTVNLST